MSWHPPASAEILETMHPWAHLVPISFISLIHERGWGKLRLAELCRAANCPELTELHAFLVRLKKTMDNYENSQNRKLSDILFGDEWESIKNRPVSEKTRENLYRILSEKFLCEYLYDIWAIGIPDENCPSFEENSNYRPIYEYLYDLADKTLGDKKTGLSHRVPMTHDEEATEYERLKAQEQREQEKRGGNAYHTTHYSGPYYADGVVKEHGTLGGCIGKVGFMICVILGVVVITHDTTVDNSQSQWIKWSNLSKSTEWLIQTIEKRIERIFPE